MTRTSRSAESSSPWRSDGMLAALFAAAVLMTLLFVSPYALIALLVDGLPALLMMAAVCAGGVALMPRLGFSREPIRRQIAIGSALGVGLFSLIVLLTGLAGLHSRTALIVLLAFCAGAGLLRARALRGACSTGDAPRIDSLTSTPSAMMRSRLLWLLLVPTAVCALLAAATAPGLIWKEEGFGYDVLEYHLQVPREYYEAGVIRYLPNNVYAAFPSAVEMLYLAGMLLMDDPVAGGSIAHYIHLFLGALSVFTVWAFARDFCRDVGILATVTFGSTGWLVYLSGLAYVELGLVFFGLAATSVLVRAARNSENPSGSEDQKSIAPAGADPVSPDANARDREIPYRALLISGVLAGFCASCKYTGLPMLVAPLAVMAIVLARGSAADRCKPAGVILAAALLTVSPWLLRNLAQTGNPVFPLANQVFDARPEGFGDEQARRWNVGHSARANVEGSENGVTVAARLGRAWSAVAADADLRFSPALLILCAIAGVLSRNRKIAGTLLLLLAVQLTVWLTLTHLYARFAVVLLIPAGLLAAPGMRALLSRGPSARVAAVAIAILGCAASTAATVRMVIREGATGAPASLMTSGALRGYEFLGFINESLPENAHILLVGEARPFYILRETTYSVVFNECPFISLLESGAGDAEVIVWFREQGISHLLVNWNEVHRLRASYGFSPAVTHDRIDALDRAGLTLVHQSRLTMDGPRYVDIYAVPPR